MTTYPINSAPPSQKSRAYTHSIPGYTPVEFFFKSRVKHSDFFAFLEAYIVTCRPYTVI